MLYNWQHQNWPNFQYDLNSLKVDLLAYAELMGRAQGLSEEEALAKGMAEKSKEFAEAGAELYQKA